MAEEAPSPAELQANLQEYEEQLEQVWWQACPGTGRSDCLRG